MHDDHDCQSAIAVPVKTRGRYPHCEIPNPNSLSDYAFEIIFLLTFLFYGLSIIPAMAQSDIDYTELDIEELLQVKIVSAASAARKQQPLAETAAALFVITQEDIRRAGITRIPEALRMVPGMHVAQLNSNQWAISARGLNGRFVNKLLVLVDGRSVTPLRSEIHWDEIGVMIEDIEQIEVTRGPGTSLWGENAINGIINIMTKSAQQTLDEAGGHLITTDFSSAQERMVGARHSGVMPNEGFYRIYGQYADHQDEEQSDFQMKRAGVRVDWNSSYRDAITIQGDIYSGYTQQDTLSKVTRNETDKQTHLNGLNVLGRWQHNFTRGETIIQTYYDRSERYDHELKELRNTLDMDFQHRLPLSWQQELIWGLRFRYDRVENQATNLSSQYSDNLISAFIQDEIKIPFDLPFNSDISLGRQDNFLRLSVGSKLEYHKQVGFKVQPGMRLLWNFDQRQGIWLAISRAARATTHDLRFEDSQEAEELVAHELGHRYTLNAHFSTDVSVFFNRYDNLRLNNLKTDNAMAGFVHGLEFLTHWQVAANYKIIGTYHYLKTRLHFKNPLLDTRLETIEEGNSPRHQISLRALVDLPYQLELDSTFYFVDKVPHQEGTRYSRLDVRLGYQWIPTLNLSLGVRHLLNEPYREFGGGQWISADEKERTWYFQLKVFF